MKAEAIMDLSSYGKTYAFRDWLIQNSSAMIGTVPVSYTHLDVYKRQTGGYGLGLAIARATIEKNSGHIQVHSKEGKFTVFTITLPKHHKDKRFAPIKKK